MPGTTAITFPNQVLSATTVTHLKKARNLIDRRRPIIADLLGPGLQKQKGGERIIIPWRTTRHSQTGRVVTGYDNFPQTARPTLEPGTATWAYVWRPVFWSRRDDAVYTGEASKLDVLKDRVVDTEEALKEEHELVLLRGPDASGTHPAVAPTGGVSAWTDAESWNGDDTATGFIEGAAAGGNNLHGVAKAGTAATFPGFHNAYQDIGGVFGTAGLTSLDALMIEQFDRMGQVPSSLRGYMSTGGAQQLKRGTRANEQYINGQNLDAGKMALVYNNVALTVNGRLPSTGATTTADPWSFVFVDYEHMKLVGMEGLVYSMDAFENISGTRARAAVLHLMFQHICTSLMHAALAIDGDAW